MLWLQFIPRQAYALWLPATNTPRGSAAAPGSGGGPKPTVLETSPFPRAGLFNITVCPIAGTVPAIGDGLGSGSGEGQSNDGDPQSGPRCEMGERRGVRSIQLADGHWTSDPQRARGWV